MATTYEQIDALEIVIADAAAKLTEIKTSATELEKVGYEKGLAEGKASVPVTGNTDVDSAVEAAVAPLKLQIAELESKVVALGDKVSKFDAWLVDLEGFQVAKIEEVRELLKS